MQYVLGYLKKAGFNNKELLEIKTRLLASVLDRTLDCEYLSYNAILNGLKRGSMQVVDDCLEKKCSYCHDFFPCDLEFFHSDGKDALRSRCKPCCAETKSD